MTAANAQEAVGIGCCGARHHFPCVLLRLSQLLHLLFVDSLCIGNGTIAHLVGKTIDGVFQSLVARRQTLDVLCETCVRISENADAPFAKGLTQSAQRSEDTISHSHDITAFKAFPGICGVLGGFCELTEAFAKLGVSHIHLVQQLVQRLHVLVNLVNDGINNSHGSSKRATGALCCGTGFCFRFGKRLCILCYLCFLLTKLRVKVCQLIYILAFPLHHLNVGFLICGCDVTDICSNTVLMQELDYFLTCIILILQ